MYRALVSLLHQLNAHPVSNPDQYVCLTDAGFLGTTDTMTVDLIDAIDAAARSLLSNGDGTINRWALNGLRTIGVMASEAGSPDNPTDKTVVIACEHGELVIPI